MKKPKVLYVITKSNWYGAQKYTHKLATSLSRHHYEVAVALGGGGVLGDEPPGPLKDHLTSAGIRTIFVPELKRDVSSFHELRATWALWRLFRHEKPDVVHLSSSKAGGEGAFAARLAGVPRIVFTSHGLPVDEDRGPVARALIRLATWATFLLAHRVILISRETFARASRFPGCRKRTRLIYNGAPEDLQLFNRSTARSELLKAGAGGEDGAKEAIWIGTIAELARNKSLDTLLSAVGILQRDALPFHICLIGDGDEAEALKRQATEERVSERVTFTGFLPEAARYLNAFDIFALPSIKEGLPYVLLEAGVAGCAVVASRIPGATDIVEDGTSGLLTPVRDPLALAAALKSLILESGKRRELARALKERVCANFSNDRMLRETWRTYE